MSSWTSFFNFGKKPIAISTPTQLSPPPEEGNTYDVLCCRALTAFARTKSPTFWPHAPKYSNRLKDFLAWMDSAASPDAEWTEIASATDLDRADFALMVLTDGAKTGHVSFFIPLYTTTGVSTAFAHMSDGGCVEMDHKEFLSTGNHVRLVCPECKAGFRITFLLRRGRVVDLQFVDVRERGVREAVGEMKRLFPGWRVDALKAVLARYEGDLKEAVEEIGRLSAVD